MTKEELKKDIYYELRNRFNHTTDPYRDIATFALNDFFADYVANKLSTRTVAGQSEQLDIIIERFSDENLEKLQKHFVSLYGSDEMAQEKANSFAVGFGKACELIIKDLNAL